MEMVAELDAHESVWVLICSGRQTSYITQLQQTALPTCAGYSAGEQRPCLPPASVKAPAASWFRTNRFAVLLLTHQMKNPAMRAGSSRAHALSRMAAALLLRPPLAGVGLSMLLPRTRLPLGGLGSGCQGQAGG